MPIVTQTIPPTHRELVQEWRALAEDLHRLASLTLEMGGGQERFDRLRAIEAEVREDIAEFERQQVATADPSQQHAALTRIMATRHAVAVAREAIPGVRRS